MRFLYFHEAGVIADLDGNANFRLQPCGEQIFEVLLSSPACCSQVFAGSEKTADDFLASLASLLEALPVGGSARGAAEQDGIYDKYLVRYADGSATDPNAKYFVLRYDTDPHARKAMYAYAGSVGGDKPKLAADILASLAATLKRLATLPEISL